MHKTKVVSALEGSSRRQEVAYDSPGELCAGLGTGGGGFKLRA